MKLPEGLIRGDGYGVGEVDAPCVFARHRDLEEAVGVARIEVLWQAASLAAEDQRITRLE